MCVCAENLCFFVCIIVSNTSDDLHYGYSEFSFFF